MKEAFTKIKESISNIHRVVKTDEDLEWNRAIYKCSTIVSEVEAEFGKDINVRSNKSTEHINKSSDCSTNCSTNGDKIRSMSDEELAEFLPIVSNFLCRPTDECMNTIFNRVECEKTKECALEWLKSPTTD